MLRVLRGVLPHFPELRISSMIVRRDLGGDTTGFVSVFRLIPEMKPRRACEGQQQIKMPSQCKSSALRQPAGDTHRAVANSSREVEGVGYTRARERIAFQTIPC